MLGVQRLSTKLGGLPGAPKLRAKSGQLTRIGREQELGYVALYTSGGWSVDDPPTAKGLLVWEFRRR